MQIDTVAQRNPRWKTRIKNCEVMLDHLFGALVRVCELTASSRVLVEFIAEAVTVNASHECLGKQQNIRRKRPEIKKEKARSWAKKWLARKDMRYNARKKAKLKFKVKISKAEPWPLLGKVIKKNWCKERKKNKGTWQRKWRPTASSGWLRISRTKNQETENTSDNRPANDQSAEMIEIDKSMPNHPTFIGKLLR